MNTKTIGTEWTNFLNNIAWLRKSSKMTKKEMAEIMNISVENLDKIERGELPEQVSVKVIFKISEVFEIHPEYLFGINFSQGEKRENNRTIENPLNK